MESRIKENGCDWKLRERHAEPGKKKEGEKARSLAPSLGRILGVVLSNLQRWPKGEIGFYCEQVQVDRKNRKRE